MDAFVTGLSGSSVAKTKTPDTSLNAAHTIPWVEKYRPKNVSEIVCQEDVVSVLKKCIVGSDIPNLLFYGPPGTGKSSAALAVARELFGPETYRKRVLELNASDERGIQVVRQKIKQFAQTAVSSKTADGKPCCPIKLIILDEADSMTTPAQAALRRTMERESKTTRFCFICNYISRIIDPLTSRCAKFRFKPLPRDLVRTRLLDICTAENLQCSDEGIEQLITSCEGDLRKAVTLLQSASAFGAAVRDDDIVEISGTIPEVYVDNLLAASASLSYEKLEECVKSMIYDGYPAYDLILKVFDRVVASDQFPDEAKSNIMTKLATCDARLMDGADEYLQIIDLGCAIMAENRKLPVL